MGHSSKVYQDGYTPGFRLGKAGAIREWLRELFRNDSRHLSLGEIYAHYEREAGLPVTQTSRSRIKGSIRGQFLYLLNKTHELSFNDSEGKAYYNHKFMMRK